MSHHGDDPDALKKMQKNIKMLDTVLGATGRYPEGRLNPNDEGELAFAVGIEEGKIALRFGKPVAWFAMNRQQALQLIALLQEKTDILA